MMRPRPILTALSWRDLWSDRWRAAAIVVTLAAGIGMAAGSDMAFRTLLETRDAIFAECAAADLELRLLPRDVAHLPDLTALEDVAEVEHRLIFPGTIDLPSGACLSAQAVFLARAEPRVNRLQILDGAPLAPDDTAGVVIEQALARYHGVTVGDTLRLSVGRARYNCPVRGVALSAEFVSASTNPQSFIPQKGSLAVVFGNLDRIADRLGFAMINSIAVRLQPGADAREARRAVLERLDGASVEQVVPREQQFSYHFLEIDIQALAVYVPAVRVTLGGLSLLIAVLGFRRMVWVRRREIGTLRALGYGRREVLASFGATGLVLGLLGAGLGAPITVAIRDAFAGIYGNAIGMPRIDHHFFHGPFALAAAQALVISTGTMLICVGHLLRMSPQAVLQSAETRQPSQAGVPRLFLRCTAPLQVSTRWALRNLVRRPGLTTTTVLAVGIAVGVAAAYRISLHSMREAARVTCEHERWDLQVDFHYPVYPEELTELRSLPGVLDVDPFLARPVEVAANRAVDNVVLFGLDPASDFRNIAIDHGRDLAPEDSLHVVLSPDVARRLGAMPGDTLRIQVPEGDVVQAQVVGVARDIVLGRVLAPLAVARAWTGRLEQSSGVFLRGNLDAEAQARLAAIEFVARSHPKSELLEAIFALLDQEIAIVNITAMISIGIALLFLLTSLNLAVAERVGEYATLRSLGCDPPMLAGMVRIEGLAQASLAALVALPAAVLISVYLNGRLGEAWFPLALSIGLNQILPPILGLLILAPIVALPAVRGVLSVDLASVLRQRVVE